MQKELVKAHYESDAETYDQEFYKSESKYPTLRYRHDYMFAMAGKAELPDDARILDIGCGPGEMVMDLATGNRHVIGIDIAPEMIRLAEERLAKRKDITAKVELGVGDIENLSYPDHHFDMIICSGVVEYLSDDIKWAKEIKRVLKPGGYLIINVTNKFCIRKWTEPFIVWLKRFPPIRNLGSFIKVKILGKPRLHEFPFQPRVHSPKKFDQYLNRLGMDKVSHNYFDFALQVAPLDTLFGFIMTPIRRWMERFSEKNMILNGTGYIVCARMRSN